MANERSETWQQQRLRKLGLLENAKVANAEKNAPVSVVKETPVAKDVPIITNVEIEPVVEGNVTDPVDETVQLSTKKSTFKKSN